MKKEIQYALDDFDKWQKDEIEQIIAKRIIAGELNPGDRVILSEEDLLNKEEET